MQNVKNLRNKTNAGQYKKKKTKENQETVREQTVQNVKESGFKVMLTFEKITGTHLHPDYLRRSIKSLGQWFWLNVWDKGEC